LSDLAADRKGPIKPSNMSIEAANY